MNTKGSSYLRRAVTIAALTLPLLAAGPAFSQSAPQAVTTDGRASTVIVFDVSNSMWGQIEGRSKIEIAREVIEDLLYDWNPDVDLGLVAYGHRRAGDCGDIEEVIPVGRVDPDSFSDIVHSLVPRGKTPLTEAVREAAEILNYRDSRATVILVSDGIESCNADPCALARELERGGIDFTAHVVGFDVGRIADQRQLSCLADTTGGRYLTADSAGELLSALRTVAAPPPPPPPMLRLEAVGQAGGAAIDDAALRWTVVALDREETVLGGDAVARPELDVEAGRYFARAELGDRVGSIEFDYPGDVGALHQVVLAISARLDAPDEAEGGTVIEVFWSGPNAPGDYIALAEPDAPASSFVVYARTSAGSPAELSLPEVPGKYQLRYIDAAGGRALADAPIRVTGAAATLEAAPTVEAGAAFNVTWTGPENQNDVIIIVPAGADEGAQGNYTYTRNGSPAEIKAPDQTGSYELRYVSGLSRATLARLPVAVTAALAALEAPPAIGAGADIPVTWTGPDNQTDTIIIVPVGAEEGAHGTYTYTRKGSPLKVRAPDEAGSYELRYVTAQTRATLVRLPIAVTEATAELEAQPSANAGAEVAVTWTGPDNQNDTIIVVPAGAEEGAHGAYTYTRNGSPAKVRMPETPGGFELRYVAAQSRRTLARLSISLSPVTATLDAAPVAPAGSKIQVTWTGPDNRNDYIAITLPGQEGRQQVTYTYTRSGSPLIVRAPKEPGSYELRYVTAQDKNVLARLPITVN
jgi:Ca-activated chloride channel family protein